MPEGINARMAIPDLAEAQMNALNKGISLFQCVWPTKVKADVSIQGFLGVSVTDLSDNANTRSRLVAEWFTRSHAITWFHRLRQSPEVAVAWIPDDMFWHNRIMFMNNERFKSMISMMRGAGGDDKSAGRVFAELKVLEAELKTPTKIFKILKNGQEVDYKFNKEEADALVNDIKFVPQKDPKTGAVIYAERRGVKYTIVEAFKLAYKPEITAMINKGKHVYRYGWSENPEFMNVIKPRVMKKITEMRDSDSTPSIINPQTIAQGIASMSDEDKELIRQSLMRGPEPKVDEPDSPEGDTATIKRPRGRPKVEKELVR